MLAVDKYFSEQTSFHSSSDSKIDNDTDLSTVQLLTSQGHAPKFLFRLLQYSPCLVSAVDLIFFEEILGLDSRTFTDSTFSFSLSWNTELAGSPCSQRSTFVRFVTCCSLLFLRTV